MRVELKRIISINMIINNSICFDVEHGMIRRFIDTTTNIHDDQMLRMLLDHENQDNYA